MVVEVKEKLLVTTEAITLDGFRVVSTLVGVDWGKVEGIVFNSCKDDDLIVLSEIARVKDKLKFFIYVNTELKPIYFGLFSGIGADIYKDSELLYDESVVKYMVENYGSTGFTVNSPSRDFQNLHRCLVSVLQPEDGQSDVTQSKLWRKTVAEAMATVDTSLARADQINSDMVRVIGQAKEKVEKLLTTNHEITEQLGELNDRINQYADGLTQTPLIYAPYKVPVATKRVLYIKYYSHCSYLVSFLIAYQKYLKSQLSLNSRMLLVLPNLQIHAARYQEIPRLAVETLGALQTLNKELYCTYEPKREVLKRFFEGSNMVYFVLDEMYSNELLSGAKVVKFNAVSGLSDIERFNLNASRTFFSVSGLEEGFTIPYFQDYNTKFANNTAKLTAYYTGCKSLYERLNQILEIS